jgi:hypothetical protein
MAAVIAISEKRRAFLLVSIEIPLTCRDRMDATFGHG